MQGIAEVVIFPRIAGVQWSNTVGSTLWGMASSVAVVLDIVLWPCIDRAGVLPAPAGGVVVAVGCTVLQTWRDGVLWALQVRVLRAPAVVGHAAVPDPPGRSAGVHTRRSGGHVEVLDPSRGEVRDFGCAC